MWTVNENLPHFCALTLLILQTLSWKFHSYFRIWPGMLQSIPQKMTCIFFCLYITPKMSLPFITLYPIKNGLSYKKCSDHPMNLIWWRGLWGKEYAWIILIKHYNNVKECILFSFFYLKSSVIIFHYHWVIIVKLFWDFISFPRYLI